jgi:hypothetical protein
VQKLAVGDANAFESMSDEELRQYINDVKSLDQKGE